MVDRYDAFLHKTYIDGNSVKYEDYKALEAKLAEAKKSHQVALTEFYDLATIHSPLVIEHGKLFSKLSALVDEVQEVVNRGEVFDAKGSHSKWVCDKLKAAIDAAKVTP